MNTPRQPQLMDRVVAAVAAFRRPETPEQIAAIPGRYAQICCEAGCDTVFDIRVGRCSSCGGAQSLSISRIIMGRSAA